MFTFDKENNRIIASKNHYVTNGVNYALVHHLAVNDSVDNWDEITEEEYNNIMKNQELGEE